LLGIPIQRKRRLLLNKESIRITRKWRQQNTELFPNLRFGKSR
jgi:hypothetical protein